MRKTKDWPSVVGELAPHLGMILATVVHLNGTIDAAAWIELLKWYIGFTAAGQGLRVAGGALGRGVEQAGERVYAAFTGSDDDDHGRVYRDDKGGVYKLTPIGKD